MTDKEFIQKYFDNQLGAEDLENFYEKLNHPSFYQKYLEEKAVWEEQLAREETRLEDDLQALDWKVNTDEVRKNLGLNPRRDSKPESNGQSIEDDNKFFFSPSTHPPNDINEDPTIRRIPWMKKYRWHLTCVACIGLILLFMFFPNRLEDLKVDHYTNYSQPETAANTLIDSGFMAYNDHNYPEAIKHLKRIPSYEQKDNILLYLAISQMMEENWDDAITNLNELLNNGDQSQFGPVAYWYLALAHDRKGQKEEAMTIFNLIIEHNYYNADKAQKILNNYH